MFSVGRETDQWHEMGYGLRSNDQVVKALDSQIPNPGVSCSKPLGGSKVDSVFHSINQTSTRNFWELSGKKYNASS